MQNKFRPNQTKKIWLKLTDNEEYKRYKRNYSHYKIASKLQRFLDEGLDTTPDQIIERSSDGPYINAFHTGNAGDIIYALPVLKALFELSGKQVNLLLKLNEPLNIGNGFEHPLGSVMLNQNMFDGLKPLLEGQSYIGQVNVFNNERTDIDLTLFRKSGFVLDRSDIARWNFFTSGVNADLSLPWLKVKPDQSFSGDIVLARSSRYNNALIDYSFLSKYKNLVFVGVESEYKEMKQSIPDLKWRQVKNFLELAEVIAGCRLFIGNQSFPYSIAEALKTPRLLEVFYQAPNVMPSGPGGYDFCFQRHFEWLVERLGKD